MGISNILDLEMDSFKIYSGQLPSTAVDLSLSLAEYFLRGEWENNSLNLFLSSYSKLSQVTPLLKLAGEEVEKRRPRVLWLSTLKSFEFADAVHTHLLSKCQKTTEVILDFHLEEDEFLNWVERYPPSSNVRIIRTQLLWNTIDPLHRLLDIVKHPFTLAVHGKEAACNSYFKYLTEVPCAVESLIIEGIFFLTPEQVKNDLKESFHDSRCLLKGIWLRPSILLEDYEPVFTEEEMNKRLFVHIEDLLKSEASAPFNKSKLIVVGEGRAGKTSTIKSLMFKEINSEEPSTKGCTVDTIDTLNWQPTKNRPLVGHLKALLADSQNHKLPAKVSDKRYPLEHSIADENNDFEEELRPDINETLSDAVAPTVEKEEIKQYGEQFIGLGTVDDELGFTIWDFGGQRVFYSQHHLFLTRYACYLTLFSLKKILNPNLRGEALSYLNFWLNNIKLHAPEAPIIIVGSHADCIEDQSQLKRVSNLLKNELLTEGGYNYISNKELEYFPVDNDKKVGVELLREVIESTVTESDYIKTPVPVSFLRLLELLVEEKPKFLMIEDAMAKRDKCGLNKKTMISALKFLNERGMISYFPKPENLSQIIVLQPQWLVDALTTVLFDPNHHEYPEYDPKFQNKFKEFMEKRILSVKLLKNMWSRKGYSTTVQQFLINLMIQTVLMCNYKWKSGKDSYFLVPDLYETYEREEFQIDGEYIKFNGPFFVFDFSGDYSAGSLDMEEVTVGFLPYGFFERLVCLAVEKSASYKETIEPKLRVNSAVISFGAKLLVEFTPGWDKKGRQLQIVVKTEAETEVGMLVGKIGELREMVDMLNTDFFSRNRSLARLPIRLLVPSSAETGAVLADYDLLREKYEDNPEVNETFFVKPNKSEETADMYSYLQWFPEYNF